MENSNQLPIPHERLRLLNKAINDAVWDWNLKTDQIWWSEGFSKMFGYKPQDINHTDNWWQEHVHPEDKDQTIKDIDSAIKGGKESWEGEYRFRCSDNTYAYVYDRGYIVYDNGEPVRMVGSMMNVTALKQQQHLTQQSENRFRSLIMEAPMATAMYAGRDMVIELANEAMIKLWGKDASVVGKTLREALPELEGQPFHQLLDQVFTTGVAYHTEEQQADLMINGRLQSSFFNFTYKPLHDSEGKVYAILNMAVDVTSHVDAKRALVDAQQTMHFALDAAEMGTWDLDPIQGIVKWDDRCKELYGFSKIASIDYADILSHIHPDDRVLVNKAVLHALNVESGGGYDVEFRTIGAEDQKLRWLRCKGKAYFNNDNVAYRFAGTALDITEAVHARENQQKLLTLVENGLDFMAVSDLDGHVVYMNKAGRQLVGLNKNVVITDKVVADFYTPEHYAIIRDQMTPALLTNGKWSGNIYLRHFETGEIIPCFANTIRINDPLTGNPIGRGLSVRDLREELAAREIQDNLLKQFEFITDFIPQIVWSTKPNGHHEFYNRRWYEYTGKNFEETKNTGWANVVHPDDVDRTWKVWEEALATGNPYNIEYRLLRYDGEHRWFLGRALPMYDDEGNIIKWFGTCTDIHEQKELERQKDDFIGIASHELKTPVTSIKAYTQVLEAMFRKSGDTKKADMLLKMEGQVNRLTNLIADLLDVTKINSGKLQFNQSYFDFNETALEIVEEVQRTTTRHTIEYDFKPAGYTFADKERIGQVITNLVANAIKYSPAADKIVVSTRLENEEIVLCVQDFGIGISADKLHRVFEQFYRVTGSKQHTFPGLGLGLYISAEIIKREGGRIWANSIEGEGSTFCFSLPVKQHHKENLL